jgi:hypothetical protein
MKTDNKKTLLALPCLSALALAVAMTHAPSVAALEIAGGDVEWNNIVRYNLGMRMEKADHAIATNPGTDESTSSYDRHDIVTNRVDWYSELGWDYQGIFGLKLSGAAWYDQAYNDKVKTGPGLQNNGSYDNNEFSSTTRRYHRGLSAELLDAYVYGNFSIGEMAGDIKVGRQTNLWGEAIALSTHSVSYSQAPVDGLKAAVAPGADAREVSMPVGQIHTNLQVTPNLALAAQYFFEFEPTRLTQGGTYLASSDILLDGPDSMNGGFRNKGVRKASNTGDWGVSGRYFYEPFNTTVGLYYREFTERGPFVSTNAADNSYEFIYPENAKLYGLSLSKLIGSASVGAELVYRKNTALNSSLANGSHDVARGDTYHALLNAIQSFGPNSLWSSASLTGEIAFAHLDEVTKNEQNFAGLCGSERGVERGCATRNVSQATLRFSPSWTAVAVGWDLGFDTAITYGLHGNGAMPGGGNEKAGSYSFGPSLTYNANHAFKLQYIDYLATKKNNPNGGILYSNGSQLQDRGWLSFTYTGQF